MVMGFGREKRNVGDRHEKLSCYYVKGLREVVCYRRRVCVNKLMNPARGGTGGRHTIIDGRMR